MATRKKVATFYIARTGDTPPMTPESAPRPFAVSTEAFALVSALEDAAVLSGNGPYAKSPNAVAALGLARQNLCVFIQRLEENQI